MQKDDNVYLGHMLDTATKAVSKISGKNKKEFDTDENLRFAIAHLVQTIGEVARRVSDATRNKNPDIPWKKITGIRHIIVHDYLDVDYDLLWEVTKNHLPPLINQLKNAINKV